jgi:hypothetical protein
MSDVPRCCSILPQGIPNLLPEIPCEAPTTPNLFLPDIQIAYKIGTFWHRLPLLRNERRSCTTNRRE